MDSTTKAELEGLIRTAHDTLYDIMANGENRSKMHKAADNLDTAIGILNDME